MGNKDAAGRNAKSDNKLLGKAVKVAAGSVAAGLIVTGNPADADIVVVEVNDTISIDADGFFMGYDLDGSGSEDVFFFGGLSNVDFETYAIIEGYSDDGFSGVAALNSGDLIDELANFVGTFGGVSNGLHNSTYREFEDTGIPTYAGFIFSHQNFGEVFAWADLAVAGEFGPLQVNRFAFETSGGPIVAGATGVPEPSALSLLALGAAAVVSRRRRPAVAR